MLVRIILAFTGTVAVCLGIAWLRGGVTPSDWRSDPNDSAGTRRITLAVSGMH
jgi:hypothetical protein